MKNKHIIYFPTWVNESVELENNPAAKLFNNLPAMIDKISDIENDSDPVSKFEKVKGLIVTSSDNLEKHLSGGELNTPEGDADTKLIVKWMFICNILADKKIFPGYISVEMEKTITKLKPKMTPLLTINNPELVKYKEEVSKFKNNKIASIASEKQFKPLLDQYGLSA